MFCHDGRKPRPGQAILGKPVKALFGRETVNEENAFIKLSLRIVFLPLITYTYIDNP